MNTSSDSPTCEIVTIGSELLLGQIQDTNTTYLAQELGKIGITVLFRTSVGDQLSEIKQVIGSALGRCDMVMITGGLGPTLDDLTREAVAEVADVKLEFRQNLMDKIEAYFDRIGYQMPENNRRQAFVPTGSQPILNPVGTAPGFISEVNGKPIICLPGVPRELKYLMDLEVSHWIKKKFNLLDNIVTYRVLKVVGIGESGVDRLIGDLMGEGKNPEIGLLASTGEVRIRITATAKGEKGVQALIQPVEKEIRDRMGKKIYGKDDDSLEGVIDSLLDQQKSNLAILETFSGGMAAQRLHQLPSSRLIDSRVIPNKGQLTNWSGQEIEELDEETAFLLARKISERCEADTGLAILGFPQKNEDEYSLEGYAAAVGRGIHMSFSWKMGGKISVIQQRGSVIGLNTLRLALLDVK